MSELLKNLMNCGFIIFKSDTKFVLKKMATPCDSRESITDTVQSNTSEIIFNDYDEAVQAAKKLLNIKCVQKIQMCYTHRGLGVQFEDLGELTNVSFSEATQIAKQRAQEFADSNEMVENWEVKVSVLR